MGFFERLGILCNVLAFALLLLFLFLWGVQGTFCQEPTSTPFPTPTVWPTPTAWPTPTPGATPTAFSTPTPMPTSTLYPTPMPPPTVTLPITSLLPWLDGFSSSIVCLPGNEASYCAVDGSWMEYEPVVVVSSTDVFSSSGLGYIITIQGLDKIGFSTDCDGFFSALPTLVENEDYLITPACLDLVASPDQNRVFRFCAASGFDDGLPFSLDITTFIHNLCDGQLILTSLDGLLLPLDGNVINYSFNNPTCSTVERSYFFSGLGLWGDTRYTFLVDAGRWWGHCDEPSCPRSRGVSGQFCVDRPLDSQIPEPEILSDTFLISSSCPTYTAAIFRDIDLVGAGSVTTATFMPNDSDPMWYSWTFWYTTSVAYIWDIDTFTMSYVPNFEPFGLPVDFTCVSPDPDSPNGWVDDGEDNPADDLIDLEPGPRKCLYLPAGWMADALSPVVSFWDKGDVSDISLCFQAYVVTFKQQLSIFNSGLLVILWAFAAFAIFVVLRW